jgi:TetR/AcrR family transcriptional regulator, transcriptional repressor for nem operon
MRVTREQAAENRGRIVDVAAQRFRERGFEGIGVSDLMKEAGLTHGGFYGHFGSKEELMAEAYRKALEHSHADWRKRAEGSREPLVDMARHYLTTRHRDNPGRGCAVAALGADVARQGPAVRQAFTEGLRTALDFMAGLAQGRTAKAKRRKAIQAYASWIGAMVLARAVDEPELSREILEAVVAETGR